MFRKFHPLPFALIGRLFLLLIISISAKAQPLNEYREFNQLDSIARDSGRGKYFAEIYIQTIREAEHQLMKADSGTRQFVRKFEIAFTTYFIEASNRHAINSPVDTIWQSYFTHNNLNQLQYQLLGANAHINGDLWKALTASFSASEIRNNKKGFLSYQQSLNKVYLDLYEKARKGNARVRRYHLFSLGFDKAIGKYLLKKWRKRQVKLALSYLNGKPGTEKKLARIERKRERINRKIIRLFRN